jgi:hypothetical protein
VFLNLKVNYSVGKKSTATLAPIEILGAMLEKACLKKGDFFS